MTEKIVHSAAMGVDLTIAGHKRPQEPPRAAQSGGKFISLAQLRKMRECEQVAAICYRVRSGVVEFLLVRTRSGRWIFPKGNTEPGLTHAQAAAMEAFEEAGVHGRMEEGSFIRYTRRKDAVRPASSQTPANQIGVNAFLCEVLRLERPPEAGRSPTWFSAEKAKRRLREDRSRDYGAELASVIECAATRIQHAGSGRGAVVEGIQKVQFIDVRRTLRLSNGVRLEK